MARLKYVDYLSILEETSAVTISLLERAAEDGNPDAQYQLGRIYEIYPSALSDENKAIQYFKNAVEQGHPQALTRLKSLLVQTRPQIENSPYFRELLELAASKGNLYALDRLGRLYTDEGSNFSDTRMGIEMLSQAAESGFYESTMTLSEMVNTPTLQAQFTEEEIERWASEEVDLQTIAKRAAGNAIREAMPFIEEKRYGQALSIIDWRYAQFREQEQKDMHAFLARIWWEAQTQTGKSDPEWGWRLFKWEIPQYDIDRYANSSLRLTIRSNVSAILPEVGRIGLNRQICDDIRVQLREIYGIEIPKEGVQQIKANDSIPIAIQFPSRISREMKNRSDWKLTIGSWLTQATMSCLISLGEHSLYTGDWQEALYLSYWVESWADDLLREKQLPGRENRSWIEETRMDALILRAETFELLENFAGAIGIYESIRLDGKTPYKGRKVDRATMREASLRARFGSENSITIKELEEMEPRQRRNHFDRDYAGEENLLTRAALYFANGDLVEANSLMQRVLRYSEENERPFLRLKALIIDSEFGLSTGSLDGIESQLMEALKLCQSKGIKHIEPRLYQLYSSYLLQSGDLSGALQIQVKAIEQIEGLKLHPLIPSTTTRLASIYESLGNPETALSILQNNEETRIQDVATINRLKQEIAKRTSQKNSRELATVDLQPEIITSAPLPDRRFETVFTLSNLSPKDATIRFSITGVADFKPLISPNTLHFDITPSQSQESETVDTNLRLGSMEQQFIHLAIEPQVLLSETPSFKLSASSESITREATLTLLRDPGTISSAVIDAALIRDNPFYLISTFHHLSNADPETQKEVGLRAVASQPTRIEAYDENGILLFIDAQGNGSFDDPGDLLATKHLLSSYPVLILSEKDRRIEFLYQPHKNDFKQITQIEIQRLERSTSRIWKTDVIDIIKPFATDHSE